MTTRKVMIALVLVVATYIASGFYVVQSDERGVVRVLGEAQGPFLPGLHWTLPWPLARVDKPKTSDVRQLDVALIHPDSGGTLTGDTHVLDVVAALQYQVLDAVAFVLATEEPDAFIARALRSAIVEVVGRASVDDALTAGRATLGRAIHERAQRQLDDAALGVLVVAVTLDRLEAPAPVRPAFQDAVGARKDAERAIDRAHSAAAGLVSQAAGNATAIVEDAAGTKARVVAEARGRAQRFEALRVEHERAPELLERRLMLETLEVVLPRLRTYVVDESISTQPLRLIEASSSKDH